MNESASTPGHAAVARHEEPIAPTTLTSRQMQLPPVDHSAIPSYRFANRSPSVLLVLLGCLFASAAGSSFVIRLDVSVRAVGVVQPHVVQPVRPLMSGTIIGMPVRAGQQVAEGDLLFQLDTFANRAESRILGLQAAEGRVALHRAAATLPLSIIEQRARMVGLERAVQRAQAALRDRLVDMTSVSNTDSVLRAYRPGSHQLVDLALADVRAAQADLRAAGAALDRLRVDSSDLASRRLSLARIEADIDRTDALRQRLAVKAPIAGTILTDELEKKLGAYVQAGEQVLEIGRADAWRVDLFAAERDVHDVRVGQRASLEIPALKALDGRRLSGRVLSVAPQPASSLALGPGVTRGPGSMFRITIELDDLEIRQLDSETLRTGFIVRGRVVTRSGSIASLTLSFLRDQISNFR